MLNQVVLTGNLGADPEIFYSSEGDPVATFNLAFKSSKKKEACWIKCVSFRKLAEITERHLHKGARIAIVGTLDQNRWESDEGVTKTNFQLICNTLEFIKTDGTRIQRRRNQQRGYAILGKLPMTQRTIDLLVRIAIEIVDFIDTILKRKRGSNDSKGTSKKKRKG